MADVKFACPSCQLHIKVDVEYVGLASNCPECRTQFRIPAPPDEVKFACGGCQTRLALHNSYIGTQINCPTCQVALMVPDPKAVAKPAAIAQPVRKPAATAAPAAAKPARPAKPVTSATPTKPARPAIPAKLKPNAPVKPKSVSPADVRPAAAAAPGDGIPSVAAAARGPASRPPNIGGAGPAQTLPPGSGPPEPAHSLTSRPTDNLQACPSCGTAMEPDAIMCTSCGLNIETGKTVSAVSSKPPPAPGSRKRPATAGAGGDGKILFWVLTGVGLAIFGVTFLSPNAVLALYGYSTGLSLVVWIWATVVAWPYGTGRFLLTLLTPYSLYFIYKHSDDGRLKKSCTAWLITIVWTIIAVVILVVQGLAAAKAELESSL